MESIGSRFDMSPRDGQNEIEEFRALANYDKMPRIDKWSPLDDKDLRLMLDSPENFTTADYVALHRAAHEMASGEQVLWVDGDDRPYFAVREVTFA